MSLRPFNFLGGFFCLRWLIWVHPDNFFYYLSTPGQFNLKLGKLIN